MQQVVWPSQLTLKKCVLLFPCTYFTWWRKWIIMSKMLNESFGHKPSSQQYNKLLWSVHSCGLPNSIFASCNHILFNFWVFCLVFVCNKTTHLGQNIINSCYRQKIVRSFFTVGNFLHKWLIFSFLAFFCCRSIFGGLYAMRVIVYLITWNKVFFPQ